MLTTSVTNYTHIPETPDLWFCSRDFKFNHPNIQAPLTGDGWFNC